MSGDLAERVSRSLRQDVISIAPLSGGSVGEVYRTRLGDGRDVVVKVDRKPRPSLEIEGYMLRYLAERSKLPVPAVI